MSIYDATAIARQLDTFRCRMEGWKGKRYVYFDADNTLYKFSTYKMSELALQQCYSEGFYKNLPVFPEAATVITNLQKLGIHCGIVSTYIDSPYCYNEKMESFRYYFPMIGYNDIYLIAEGDDKTTIMPDVEHSVLVDDYYVNLNNMFAAGGVGVKKSYSGKERPLPVIKSLIDLFPVLHDLNYF